MPFKPIADQDGVRRLLKSYDVHGALITNILNFGSLNTGRSRAKNPGSLTIDEYAKLCRTAHIPAEEARAALRFGT